MSQAMFDISSNNEHPINFQTAADHGYHYVMIKATEGLNYTNPYLEQDAHGARAAGMQVGYYHFARPGESNANAQAQFFLQEIKSLPRSIGGCLDLEISDGLSWAELANWGKQFLTTLPPEVKQKILYCSSSWANSLPNAPWGNQLWIASWGQRPRRKCWAWQSSGSGEVPGVTGECDIDVFYGPTN